MYYYFISNSLQLINEFFNLAIELLFINDSNELIDLIFETKLTQCFTFYITVLLFLLVFSYAFRILMMNVR
jgi:hypothetical protein